MSAPAPLARRYPGRYRLAMALTLHCLPLFAATSFLVRGYYGESAQETWFRDLRWFVVLSAFCWGLGYLPLRRWGRAAAAFAAGVVGNLLAANAALSAWSIAPDGAGDATLNRAALTWGSVIAIAVGALLIDTWLLGCNARTTSPNPAQNNAVPESVTG